MITKYQQRKIVLSTIEPPDTNVLWLLVFPGLDLPPQLKFYSNESGWEALLKEEIELAQNLDSNSETIAPSVKAINDSIATIAEGVREEVIEDLESVLQYDVNAYIILNPLLFLNRTLTIKANIGPVINGNMTITDSVTLTGSPLQPYDYYYQLGDYVAVYNSNLEGGKVYRQISFVTSNTIGLDQTELPAPLMIGDTVQIEKVLHVTTWSTELNQAILIDDLDPYDLYYAKFLHSKESITLMGHPDNKWYIVGQYKQS